ncbi:DUF1003 domain-containing protein [Novosphingobium album (ex Liu et al. 2023)]|uniref:DUF1003 domain-containing protein n=1 Tax=Novosphingobium album (ex Liu et al. 2023) TaxID=3031130 RepID=A0ABT5WW72_9SPHN|nr:DUF1003 domain-containing protein [Novosphingobium album (ex Liu et al. 2023)]MDE8654133.1 DUF1003 domain-containing protein [Novosphingobium album (ex Liu et al. 2023)]
MLKTPRTPEQLAEDLLGRLFEELDEEEQRVLQRISSGVIMGPDAQEEAALHATFADRLADKVAAVGGSWAFIIGFGLVLLVWILVNGRILEDLGLHPFDGYPFIFLNLILSMLAAIQAPVIMMSQNRQADKDRITARHDYEVNLRTQLEIIRVHRRLDRLLEKLDVVLERDDD